MIKEVRKEQGIIFEDLSHAIREYPNLVKDHFMKVVPPRDHKFAALHGAVWS
jgi:Fe-S cluster assembly protein SufB